MSHKEILSDIPTICVVNWKMVTAGQRIGLTMYEDWSWFSLEGKPANAA